MQILIGQNGDGLDHETFKDKGAVNWVSGSVANIWTITGSDFFNSATGSQIFNTGLEDLNIKITPLVEEWIARY